MFGFSFRSGRLRAAASAGRHGRLLVRLLGRMQAMAMAMAMAGTMQAVAAAEAGAAVEAGGMADTASTDAGAGASDAPFGPDEAAAGVTVRTIVDQLANTPVSRLEWGMLQIQRYLDEEFAIDPETLAPYDPRFYINVEFNAASPRLVIEVGRTFPSLNREQAPTLCRDYVNRVRILFNVDRVGRPIGKPYSTLARDFFLSPESEVDPATADAIDAMIYVEGLVASPITGVYSVCGAGLRDPQVRALD